MPARVLRACAAGLGDPRRKHLAPWDLVEAIDEANGNKAARSIYRRLYVPLSNYTVHASGGTLLRHVHRQEIYAMLCCYQAIRTLISHAAGDAGLDPARISFTRARDAIRSRISDSGCFSP